jgi:dipeptidyl aminopeptidase/acylaminoacyl peptidase
VKSTAFIVSATALLLLSATNVDSAESRRFTVADDVELAHSGDLYTVGETESVIFSPDGRYFAVDIERGRLDVNRCESAIRIYSSDEVRRALLRKAGAVNVKPFWTFSRATNRDGPIITRSRWLPDSSGIAFLLKTTSGTAQLMLGDVNTKTVRALTLALDNITAFDIRDAEHFVYTVPSPAIREKASLEGRRASITVTGRAFDSVVFPDELYPRTTREHDLSELWAVVDGRRFRVEGGKADQPFRLHQQGQDALSLSPDGHAVVTARAVATVPSDWASLYPPSQSTWQLKAGDQDVEALDGQLQISEYVLVDLLHGSVQSLTSAPIGLPAGWAGSVRAAWAQDGKWIVLSNTFINSQLQLTDVALRAPCIAAVDLATGSVACLERLKGLTTVDYRSTRYVFDLKFVTGRSDAVSASYLALADGSRGSVSYVRTSDGTWDATSSTNELSAKVLPLKVAVKQSLNDRPAHVATERGTDVSRVIFDPNPNLQRIRFGKVSVFRWRDASGREWIGGLYKPPDFAPGRRYPLIIQNHGFVDGQFRPSGAFPSAFAAQELAAAGMLVLQVADCPGRGDPEEGPCNVRGYEAAVAQLTVDGLVDSTRLGLIGFSRTCYYVLEALTTSQLHFTAASITDGISEGYMQYMLDLDITGNVIARDAEGVIGAQPFGNGLQRWIERSPSFKVNSITAPLQIVAIGRQSVSQMWESYAALRYLNKPVDFILLTDGNHILSSPVERMVSQGGTVDWFRFWLQDYEDPSPDKSAQYIRWRGLKKLQAENDAKARGAARVK